jgi:hypothetical protein
MLLQCHAYEAKMAIFAQGFEDGTVTSWEFPIERLHELVSEAVSGDPVWLLQELFAEMMAEPEIDEEWLDLEGQYAIAKQAVDQAKEALDEIADKMKAGGAREGARYSVIQQTRQGSVDMKKLAAEHPEVDLDQFRKKQMTFMSIREVKA